MGNKVVPICWQPITRLCYTTSKKSVGIERMQQHFGFCCVQHSVQMITDEDLNLQQHYYQNLKSCNSTDAKFEVLKALLLGIQIVYGVMLGHCLSGSQHVQESRSLQNVTNHSPKTQCYIQTIESSGLLMFWRKSLALFLSIAGIYCRHQY
jgi:hypothetical protein